MLSEQRWRINLTLSLKELAWRVINGRWTQYDGAWWFERYEPIEDEL